MNYWKLRLIKRTIGWSVIGLACLGFTIQMVMSIGVINSLLVWLVVGGAIGIGVLLAWCFDD